MTLQIDCFVRDTRPNIRSILSCARSSSRAPSKQMLFVSEDRGQDVTVDGTSKRAGLGLRPPTASQKACLGRAAPQLRPLRGTGKALTPRGWYPKPLLGRGGEIMLYTSF